MEIYRYDIHLRQVIFIFLLLSSTTLWGQEELFKVISCSEGVLLDGKKVDPGVTVFSTSKDLSIPKSGYAGVLTNEGYAFLLTRPMKARKVVSFVHRKKNPPPTGAVHRGGLPELEMVGMPKIEYASLQGDSLILLWTDQGRKGPPYFLEVKNMFEELILIDTLSEKWKTYDRKKIIGSEGAVLVHVWAGRKGFDYYLVKAANPTSLAGIQYDLSRVLPHEDQEIIKSAIYELNYFQYDHLFYLYKWVRSGKEPRESLTRKYLDLKGKEYFLDQFDFRR